MPTAAKLVGAIVFAALSWVISGVYAQGLPEGTRTGLLAPVCAVLGLIWGWRVAGGLAGRGYGEAAANGLRAGVTIAVWATFIFSIYDMVLLSTKMRYSGPIEAILGAFSIMLDYGKYMLNPVFIGIALVSSMIGGMIAEWAAKRWP